MITIPMVVAPQYPPTRAHSDDAGLIMVTNLVTGATYEHPTCPPQTQWQYYAEHGIWACGGEKHESR